MATSVILFLFFMFLFGSTLLILVMNYRSIESERERLVELNQIALPPSDMAWLLEGSHGAIQARSRADDSVAMTVEDYLRSELARAGEFVSDPSVESLYRHTDPAVRLN